MGWLVSVAIAGLPLPAVPPPEDPVGERSVSQTAWGGPFDTYYCEHFQLQVLEGESFEESALDGVFEVFEEARTEQQALGFAEPDGFEESLFPLFLCGPADEGRAPPVRSGAAGYYWQDRLGIPYVALDPAVLTNPAAADFRGHVYAHEYFHGVHGETVFAADWNQWIRESAADWAATSTLEDNPSSYNSVGYMLMRPHLPINAKPTETLDIWHPYGLQLLLQRMTDTVDPLVVSEIFAAGDSTTNTLDTIDAVLSGYDTDLAAIYADWVPGLVTFEDYGTLQDRLLAAMDNARERYLDLDTADAKPVALSWKKDGTEALASPKSRYLPQAWGFNLVELDKPSTDWVRVQWRGDARGSDDTKVAWQVSAVIVDADGGEVVALTPEDGAIDTVLEVTGADRVVLTVAAIARPNRLQKVETFGYEAALASVDEPKGCNTSGAPVGWLMLLPLGLGLRRRR